MVDNSILGRPFQINEGVVDVVSYYMVTSAVFGVSLPVTCERNSQGKESQVHTQWNQDVLFMAEVPYGIDIMITK